MTCVHHCCIRVASLLRNPLCSPIHPRSPKPRQPLILLPSPRFCLSQNARWLKSGRMQPFQMGASLLLLNNILLSGRTAAGLPSASCRTPRRLPRPGPMSTAAPSIRAQLSVWTAVSSPLEKRLVSFHPRCPGAWHMACEQTRERLSTPLAGPVGGGSLPRPRRAPRAACVRPGVCSPLHAAHRSGLFTQLPSEPL